MSRLPLIHVQLWGSPNATLLGSPLFARPDVVLYIEAFASFGDVNHKGEDVLDRRTPEKRAEDTFATVRAYRDVMKQVHPTVPFKWSWWPHRFGDALSVREGSDGKFVPIDRLCYHEADQVPGIGSSVFIANSIATHGPHADRMAKRLADLLVGDGIPFPIICDADWEGGARLGDPGADGKGYTRWHPAIMAESRAHTHAIAASGLTYADFTANLIGITGKPIDPKTLYPWYYDMNRWTEAHLYNSIITMVTDHALNSTLYAAVRRYMPRTLCGNWGTHAAHRKYTSHLYRYRESPVDAGAHMGADLSIPSTYGTPFNDLLTQPTGYGYCCWGEHVRRLRIDVNGYKTPTDLAVATHVKTVDYLAQGSLHGKKPTTVNAMSLTWRGEGIWSGVERYADSTRHPPQLIGGVLDYNAPGVAQQIFDALRRGQVQHLEIFAQPSGTAQTMRDGFDRMAKTLGGIR